MRVLLRRASTRTSSVGAAGCRMAWSDASINGSWLGVLPALPYLYAPGVAVDVRSVIRLRPSAASDLIAGSHQTRMSDAATNHPAGARTITDGRHRRARDRSTRSRACWRWRSWTRTRDLFVRVRRSGDVPHWSSGG